MWQEFFPHKPRFGQDKICEFVSKNIAERRISIVEAPYGIGKTASMLASGLASGKKVIFATCDHAIQDSIVQEVLNINEKLGKKFVVAPIIGKEHLCPHLRYFSYDQCDFEKMSHHCPFYKDIYKKGKISRGLTDKAQKLLDDIIFLLQNNPEQARSKNFVNFLFERCKDKSICPYEFILELASRSDVVILDYFHVFTPIFLFMKKRVFQPESSVLFIDEADRLKERLLDILTLNLSDAGLQRIKAQLKTAMKGARKLSDWLEGGEETKQRISHAEWLFYLRFIKVFGEFMTEAESKLGAKDSKEIYKNLSKQEFVDFIEARLDGFDETARKLTSIMAKLADSGPEKKILNIGRIISLWKAGSENYFSYALFDDTRSLVLSPYELASAPIIDEEKLFLKDILKSFHSCVLFSATIGDKDIFAESLGIDKFESFSSHEFNTQNYLVVLKRDISSVYRERSSNIEGIIRDIAICKNLARGVLISFPSYDCCNEVLRHLEAKPIQDAETDGIYYVVTGGKGSRGINKAAKLNVAYIYGMQLAKPDDYLFNKRREFALQKYGQEKAMRIIYNDVVNKSCQIAGRIFRDTGKKGLVVLADRRYKYDSMLRDFFYHCIPSYFKVKLVETSNPEQFRETVIKFWQNN